MSDNEREAALVAEFIAVTGCTDAEDAVVYLSRCDWQLEAAVCTFIENVGGRDGDGDGSQRAPIAPKEDVLLAQEDLAALAGRGVHSKRPASGFQRGTAARSVFDAFRNFRDDAAVAAAVAATSTTTTIATAASKGGSASSIDSATKVHELATKFRPPVDLLVRGTLDEAREQAQRAGKQLLVNIQAIEEFVSHALNRDVWADPRVRQIIAMHFCLWQVLHDSEDGARFARLYHVDTFPAIAVLDPLSGECLLRCTVPPVVTPNLCDSILGECRSLCFL